MVKPEHILHLREGGTVSTYSRLQWPYSGYLPNFWPVFGHITMSLQLLGGSHFLWEPSVPVFGAGSENCPGSIYIFFFFYIFFILRIITVFRILKNPIRQFSGSAILTEFWTIGFEGRYSQVGSHKLWLYIYKHFLKFFFVSFLTISILFVQNFAQIWNNLQQAQSGGFFFFLKISPKK
jgi:hypothetical protein